MAAHYKPCLRRRGATAPYCVRDKGVFTWHLSTTRNAQSIAPVAADDPAFSKLIRKGLPEQPRR